VSSDWIFDIQWVKAKKSAYDGNCVQVGRIRNEVRVRNSRDPEGPQLVFTKAEFNAFLEGAKNGEFDGLAT
jgi:Domain of unknown function (DUF397)